MTENKPLAITLGIGLGILMLMAAIMFHVSPARAAENPLGCFVGASAGANATASRISDGNTQIDLGTNSPLIGAEVGCKLAMSGFSLGGLLRYDFLNAKTHIDTESIKQNGRWMALGTVGIPINLATSLYGLAGISGTKFEFADIASKTTTNLVVGLGLSTALWGTGLTGFAEYNAILPRSVEFNGASFKAAEHIARVGVRFGF